jgi:tetratricopeptide (TPR) repeat protein
VRGLDNHPPTADGLALLRSQAAVDLIREGRYEAASVALGEFWRGVGERPDVEELGERASAEVLLQAGVVSAWLGASRRVERAQEAAKDLLGESATLFDRLGDSNRVAAARSEMALCYWREGSYDEARALLEGAAALVENDQQLKARTLLRLGMVESSAGRFSDALLLLTDSAPVFDEGVGHTLQGSFHNELAIVLRRLGTAERRRDYFDRAIIEYTAAVYHFEQARHESYVGSIENNLAFLLYKLGRYAEAHEHLDRAQSVFKRLRDEGSVAQVAETRARVLVAERRYGDAERVMAGAVRALEQGDESGVLAEALTVQGVVWARLSVYESSMSVLRRAADMAESAGALASAGQAVLALIEEHGTTWRLRPDEVFDAYVRADGLLRQSQDAEDVARLRACARLVMKRLTSVQLGEEDFTLPGAVHQFEAKLIERALEESGGSVVAAARLLGLTHQTFCSILSTRHRELADKRRPPKKRLKSIIKKVKE